MKALFKLGTSTFDVEQSSIELSVTDPEEGKRKLFIEVEAVADQVAEDEEWNWDGGPPNFYLRGFTLPNYAEGSTHVLQVSMNHEEHEMALYIGEHNNVWDVVVELTAWNSVKVTGTVDAMGSVVPFHIQFALSDAQLGIQPDGPASGGSAG